MSIRITKKHIEEVAEMAMNHFGASEACNGFLEEARRILNRQRGFASFTFGGGQYVLAFWWGKNLGPTFCLLGEEQEKEFVEEEMRHWLKLATGRFSRFGFRFQVRMPRHRELAVKELAKALSCQDNSPQ